MIGNIVDRRSNQYAALKLNAVIEPSWHDSSITGADQHPRDDTLPDVEVKYGLTLADAIAWAVGQSGPMTLYVYDADDDPMARAAMPAKDSLSQFRRCRTALDEMEEALNSIEDRRLHHLIDEVRRKVEWYVKSLV